MSSAYRREVDAADDRATFREAGEIRAGAAADVEHALAFHAVEGHEAQQVVELLEMILVQVTEERRRARRLAADLEVVDVSIPVVADVSCGGTDRGGHGTLL